MSTIQAILLKPLKNKGKAGEIVSLKRGFFNYLLRMDRVIYATQEAKANLEARRAELEQQDIKAREDAQQWAEKISDTVFSIASEAGDTGILYGSISTRDIASLLAKSGLGVHPNQIVLPEPLKQLGEHMVRVDLHPSVHVDIKISIKGL